MTGLRKPCEHGRYDAHGMSPYGEPSPCRPTSCSGGSEPTVDDLIAEIQSRGIPGSVRIEYVGPPAETIYINETTHHYKGNR